MSWTVPKVQVVVAWPPVLTVAENPASGGAYGDVGCSVMNPQAKNVFPNAPVLFIPDAAKVEACTEERTELWVSNQPWDTIVTCRLRFQRGNVMLIQGSETICDLAIAADGSIVLTYRLVKTLARRLRYMFARAPKAIAVGLHTTGSAA